MRESMVLICPTLQARSVRQIGTTGSLRMARMRDHTTKGFVIVLQISAPRAARSTYGHTAPHSQRY
jgi:hypothetical protein